MTTPAKLGAWTWRPIVPVIHSAVRQGMFANTRWRCTVCKFEGTHAEVIAHMERALGVIGAIDRC